MIDGVGGFKDFELSGGIRPLIPLGSGEENRTRGAEREQTILIEGQFFGMFVELLELPVEPMREVVVDGFDGFTVGAAAGSASATTGLMGEGDGDAIIEGSGKQSGFAIARVTDSGDA